MPTWLQIVIFVSCFFGLHWLMGRIGASVVEHPDEWALFEDEEA